MSWADNLYIFFRLLCYSPDAKCFDNLLGIPCSQMPQICKGKCEIYIPACGQIDFNPCGKLHIYFGRVFVFFNKFVSS